MKYQFLLYSLLFFILLSCKKDDPVLNANPVINSFSQSVKIIQDTFEDTPIVIAGSSGKNFIVSFRRTLSDGTILDFLPADEPLPVIMKDNEGNHWDVFGRAVSGDRKGERLFPTRSMMGYWFVFNAMYPGVDIYGEEPVIVETPVISVGGGWAIPTNNVVHSLGFDAIPAIDNPVFDANPNISLEEFSHLKSEGLIVGFTEGNKSRAYPHSILNWNEIVNDEVDDLKFSVVFCPLTGTAQVWDRFINNEVTTFGVSGKLYNSNIMPYDRLTSSIWTQLDGACVHGELINKKIERLALVETTWATWKEMYPSAKVLRKPQEFSWDYTENPYQDYLDNTDLILFPVAHIDHRILAKERVHGVIINHQAKVYRFKDF